MQAAARASAARKCAAAAAVPMRSRAANAAAAGHACVDERGGGGDIAPLWRRCGVRPALPAQSRRACASAREATPTKPSRLCSACSARRAPMIGELRCRAAHRRARGGGRRRALAGDEGENAGGDGCARVAASSPLGHGSDPRERAAHPRSNAIRRVWWPRGLGGRKDAGCPRRAFLRKRALELVWFGPSIGGFFGKCECNSYHHYPRFTTPRSCT